VDAILGTNELDAIVAACEGRPTCLYPGNRTSIRRTPRVLATPPHFAYIKIAEGCDHPCTFCIIPQFRGRFRSRQPESVVAEAERLFARASARST